MGEVGVARLIEGMRNQTTLALGSLVALALLSACPGPEAIDGHGPIADDISGRLGDPLPSADADWRSVFARGKAVAEHRYLRSEGVGPAFNVSFCVACHERPVTGGGAGLYRNFAIGAQGLADGSQIPAESMGAAGGVLRIYYLGDAQAQARPAVGSEVNVIGQRNPIPFFGAGLLAELSTEEILSREDPDDADGDGISGRANWDRGFAGRFGRKAQTVSIEGFIRGPLFNHLGITSDPLSDEQKAMLPVDSSSAAAQQLEQIEPLLIGLRELGQASAPEVSLVDDDGVADPELASEDLFDLVSFAMLLAAPELEPLSEQGLRGRDLFDELRCGACHTPRLQGPRGPLPVYSDLLLHDMGEELADGLEQGLATGSEFRTQPLWGLAAVGPYLHDGRAETIEQAILLHAGEAEAVAAAAGALSEDEMADLVEFLRSLGGRDQHSPGLLEPGAEVPEVGEFGGPIAGLSAAEAAEFEAGRALFDREFGLQSGLGGPRFNGDSCRACHFEPAIGGSGPLGVNVMRHGILNEQGEFVPPAVGTILHREVALRNQTNLPEDSANVFEHRQSPPLFGLGLVDAIPDELILANADPEDSITPDGISGRVSWTDGNRLGRFGWKAQVPTLEEFVRDAVAAELGMTLPYVDGLTFGRIQDNDGVADPELSLSEADALLFFMLALGPPPRVPGSVEDPEVAAGEQLFDDLACASCHLPELGGVPLYSDLLLHEILPATAVGIEDASASMWEFRTAPLWGLRMSGPYMHSGEAETIAEAIALHDREAAGARDAYLASSEVEQAALLAFLSSL